MGDADPKREFTPMKAFVYTSSNEFVTKFDVETPQDVPSKAATIVSQIAGITPYSYIECSGSTWTLCSLQPLEISEGRVSPKTADLSPVAAEPSLAADKSLPLLISVEGAEAAAGTLMLRSVSAVISYSSRHPIAEVTRVIAGVILVFAFLYGSVTFGSIALLPCLAIAFIVEQLCSKKPVTIEFDAADLDAICHNGQTVEIVLLDKTNQRKLNVKLTASAAPEAHGLVQLLSNWRTK